MSKHPCVYLLASQRDGTLYLGVTSNLEGRIWQHQNDAVAGFSRTYGVHRLVWHEVRESMESAILREKQIKNWRRAWKIALIETENPSRQDLSPQLLG